MPPTSQTLTGTGSSSRPFGAAEVIDLRTPSPSPSPSPSRPPPTSLAPPPVPPPVPQPVPVPVPLPQPLLQPLLRPLLQPRPLLPRPPDATPRVTLATGHVVAPPDGQAIGYHDARGGGDGDASNGRWKAAHTNKGEVEEKKEKKKDLDDGNGNGNGNDNDNGHDHDDADLARVKRRRIDQALPHVSRAVKMLPSSGLKVDKIAVRALATFVDDGLPRDDVAAASRAENIVNHLAAQPVSHEPALLAFPLTDRPPSPLNVHPPRNEQDSQDSHAVSQQEYQYHTHTRKRSASDFELGRRRSKRAHIAIVLSSSSSSPSSSPSSSSTSSPALLKATTQSALIAPQPKVTAQSVAARQPAVSKSTTGHQQRHTSPFQASRSPVTPGPPGPREAASSSSLSSSSLSSSNSFFRTQARPYQSSRERQLIARRTQQLGQSLKDFVLEPAVYHVDFTQDEVARIISIVEPHLPNRPNQASSFGSLLKISRLWNFPKMIGDGLPRRTAKDLENFYSDLVAGKATHPDHGRILTLQPNDDDVTRKETRRISRVSSLLLAREMEGNRGFGHMRQYVNFQDEFRNAHEDGMSCIAEFTNCAGDIATTTWVPENNIICGTTNHSDTHNQQYNKPGNLLLCSLSKGELRAFPDHRIPRPIVEKGENSTAAMRHSQDPWLYSSVVASDYDEVHNLAYTSSFDGTVKVWKVGKDGSSMTAVATWHLGGNVNFVSAAKDGSGRVATAADVPTEAVRIYTLDRQNLANSSYISFSCSRRDADGSDKWAYFPATMQWGRSPDSRHVLAVGYSPRSLTGSDHDIPEDKRRTGEVTLWDAERRRRLRVTTATTSNFFEILWHPTLARFIAATTPGGLKVDRGVRTQIHIFQLDPDTKDSENDGYQEFQSLDCPAADINELTLMPNSVRHAYVTAGCTDGNVYVWDTAQGDKPIHVLEHGHPIDEFHEDREREDTGVKFTAWATSPDRFYSGSSDGVVKVWNVRQPRNPFVRDLLVAPGPISCGAFSPDATKLVVGDATGRVFLFSVNKHNDATAKAHYMTIPGTAQNLPPLRRRRPIPFIHHPEPPPPPPPPFDIELIHNGMSNNNNNNHDISNANGIDNGSNSSNNHNENSIHVDSAAHSEALDARRTYLDSGKLIIHSNPTIGAVQGPAYAFTNLFRADAHLDGDPAAPLLPTYARQQRANAVSSGGLLSRSLRRLKDPLRGAPEEDVERLAARHAANAGLDFDVGRLDDAEREGLLGEGALLTDEMEDWGFEYEEMPDEMLL